MKFKQKNIGILGLGLSGYWSAKLAKSFNNNVFVSDKNKHVNQAFRDDLKMLGIELEIGVHSNQILKSDVIIKSPGIPNNSEIMNKINAEKIPVISEIEFAGNLSKSKNICITGTNGKTTTVSLFGLVMLLMLNIVNWDQLVKNYKAWDTLIWLGGLLTLATGLKNNGFISWISESMNSTLVGVEPFTLLILLAMIYFYSMYVFSMLTAHIVALGSTIMVVASGTDLNPFLVVGIIAYISSLCGCLTNYSTGPVIIYFGNGYSKPSNWFKIGFFISLYHLTIWTLFGSIWWKYIGWF